MSQNIKTEKRQAVVVVLRLGERFLAIERSSAVIAPGAVCFPGGGIESGETPEEAVIRETREELGIAVRPTQKLWESETTWNVHLFWFEAVWVPNIRFSNSDFNAVLSNISNEMSNDVPAQIEQDKDSERFSKTDEFCNSEGSKDSKGFNDFYDSGKLDVFEFESVCKKIDSEIQLEKREASRFFWLTIDEMLNHPALLESNREHLLRLKAFYRL